MKNLLIGIIVCLTCALAISCTTALDPKYKVEIRAEYNDTEKTLVKKFNNYVLQHRRMINKRNNEEAITENDISKINEAADSFLTVLGLNEDLVRESLKDEITTKIKEINN